MASNISLPSSDPAFMRAHTAMREFLEKRTIEMMTHRERQPVTVPVAPRFPIEAPLPSSDPAFMRVHTAMREFVPMGPVMTQALLSIMKRCALINENYN